jgi:hypothetical protein
LEPDSTSQQFASLGLRLIPRLLPTSRARCEQLSFSFFVAFSFFTLFADFVSTGFADDFDTSVDRALFFLPTDSLDFFCAFLGFDVVAGFRDSLF